MPPIVWTALAYGVGIVAGPVVSLLSVPVAAIPLLFLKRRVVWLWALWVFAAAGVVLGRWHDRRSETSCAVTWTTGDVSADLVLLDRVGRDDMADARVVDAPCHGVVRVRWAVDRPVAGGTAVRVEGTWRRALRVTKAEVLARGVSRRGAIRGRLEQHYERLFGSQASFASALTLARPGAIDSETRERFVRAGLAHVLAISGLHVGFLGWWITWALRRIGMTPRDALVGGAVVVAAYVWLLGFPAPATRAACFLAIAVAARHRQRNVHPAGVVALAVMVVLTGDPAASRSVGAWLSLAAVVGIGWSRGALPGPAALRLSAGAMLFTAPITAYVFGTVAPVGLVANLVGVPLAALAVPGIVLSTAVTSLGLPLGETIAAGTGLTLSLLDLVAGFASRIPYGHSIGVGGWRGMWPWGACLGLVLWMRWGRPTRAVAVRRGLVPLAIGVWTWAVTGAVARDGGDDLAIHFLAVGQGDAAAVRTPQGQWVLIDAGPASRRFDAGRSVVVPYLRRQGMRRLSAAFLSHGDADHVGGMASTFAVFPPQHVWEPGQPVGEAVYLGFLDAVEWAGAEWSAARRGDTITVDSVAFIVHHPDDEWMRVSLDRNENSLLIEVVYREFRALFTGDGGLPMERHHPTGFDGITVLKVGHHGSLSSTGDAWLDQMSPSVAVVSAGQGNRFGHPRPEVLARLRAREIEIFRTDRDGSIVIRTDGREFSVQRSNRR